MKRFRRLRRWFSRRFGYARLICIALLIGFAALRIFDPGPIRELREIIKENSLQLVLAGNLGLRGGGVESEEEKCPKEEKI